MSIKKLTEGPKFKNLAIILAAFPLITTGSLKNPSLALDSGPTPILIEAEVSLEWNQIKGVYIANGDAIVEQGDKSLKGDEIVVLYNPKSVDREIVQIIATGDVVYNDGDRVARGTKIDYVIATETYVLDGPSAIISGLQSTMSAEKKITYGTSQTAKKQVIGIGNAVYKGKDGRIVEGERVLAVIDATGTIKTVNSNGNARVVTPKGIIAVADTLNYVAATDRAELFGNVEIVEGENVIRGARAEVEFDKEISRLLSDNSGKRVTGVLKQ